MSKRTHDEDEDDYMSDKILIAAAQISAPQSLNRRRPIANTQQTIPNEKSRHIIESEQRDLGLSTAISSDNKGFQLLKKMGYKEGATLGTKQSNGLIEPIPIKILPSRSGLGEQTEKQETKRAQEEVKQKFNQQIQSSYQDRLKQKYYIKHLRIDIIKSQSICERLDREKFSLEENILWKKDKQDIDDDNDEDEDEDDTNDPSQMEYQLKRLTNYLREKHFYCIWCGQAFDTFDQLEEDCPGNEKDLH